MTKQIELQHCDAQPIAFRSEAGLKAYLSSQSAEQSVVAAYAQAGAELLDSAGAVRAAKLI